MRLREASEESLRWRDDEEERREEEEVLRSDVLVKCVSRERVSVHECACVSVYESRAKRDAESAPDSCLLFPF